MTLRLLLLDECISPALVPDLWKVEIDAICVRDRGLQSAGDYTIWRLAISERRAIVTINGRDFEKLAQRESHHPGVIVIPSGHGRAGQLDCIMRVVKWATEEHAIVPSLVRRVVTVSSKFEITALEVYKTAVVAEAPVAEVVQLHKK